MPDYYPVSDECICTGLRYKPVWSYKLPYAPDTFACCDYMANASGNKIAFASNEKEYGVIELGYLHQFSDFHGDKKFYIDFKVWGDAKGGLPVATDMSFGYDYQRLYVLYKQRMTNGTYRLWLTRHETGNYKDGDLIKPPISIPLHTLVRSSSTQGHPVLPGLTYPHDITHGGSVPVSGRDDTFGIPNHSVLEYLNAYGLVGECLDKPQLDPFFNCLVAQDKVFITMPVFFKPDKVDSPWADLGIEWTPEDPRVVYQLLFMLDESTAQVEACAVVGAFSWWIEDPNTPSPDIVPEMPLKVRMTQIDDCIVWQCAHQRTFLPSMTRETWYDNPFVDYNPNAWDTAKLIDRFWQPYQTEYVKITDLIDDLLAMKTTPLQPAQYRVERAYACTPLVTDLYTKALADWSGQRVYGLRDKEFVEYEVLYHNFKRKIIRGLKVEERTEGTGIVYIPEFLYEDHHLGEFYYQCTGHFLISKRGVAVLPKLPTFPEPLSPISLPPMPMCAPIPPTYPLVVPQDFTPPDPPPIPERVVDIVFVLDVTGSMSPRLLIMADAMDSLTTQLTARGFVGVQYFAMLYGYNQYLPYSPATDSVNGPAPYGMHVASQVKTAFQRLVASAGGGYEDGPTAVLEARGAFGPEFRRDPASGSYLPTFYVIITDEPNNAGGEAAAQADAIAMCLNTNAAMTWIVTPGLSSSCINGTAAATGGRVLDVMLPNSSWGSLAADQLTDAIEDAVPPVPPIDMAPVGSANDWLASMPTDQRPLIPDLTMPIPIPPIVEQPEPSEGVVLSAPEYYGWHTFAIENLACNTWMVNVTLTCTDPNLKIGPTYSYADNTLDATPRPDETELHWDEIPPAHEVRFSVYSDDFAGVASEGMELTYELEAR